MRRLKVGELFAGVGGISTGFTNAGFDVVWANECDAKACVTYRTNFKHKMIEEDMRKINPDDLEKIDILTGGFPCQAFSIAGYRKGFDDDRGNLFFEILRFIDSHNPEVVFLENVKNLANHNKGRTFKRILEELKNRNYYTKYKVLNTCEYSAIPQNRERIYIVAFKNSKHFDSFEFPKPMRETMTIKDILEKKVDEYYYYNKTRYYERLSQEMKKPFTIYQWRRVYLRENKSGVCPTLTANMGTGGHNVPLVRDSKDIRKLTPRECFRLQGFPESFKFPEKMPKSALYKQAGNSVSVPVIERIAINIKKAIDSDLLLVN